MQVWDLSANATETVPVKLVLNLPQCGQNNLLSVIQLEKAGMNLTFQGAKAAEITHGGSHIGEDARVGNIYMVRSSAAIPSVRTGVRGAPNLTGPRAKSPPRPAPRGRAGNNSERAGRGGESFFAPPLNPSSGAPLFTRPCPEHCLYFVAYLPIAVVFQWFYREKAVLWCSIVSYWRSLIPIKRLGTSFFHLNRRKKDAIGE